MNSLFKNEKDREFVLNVSAVNIPTQLFSTPAKPAPMAGNRLKIPGSNPGGDILLYLSLIDDIDV